MRYFMVYSLRVANSLVKKGFQIVETGINLKCPQYQVFFFEDTKEFREAFSNLIASK